MTDAFWTRLIGQMVPFRQELLFFLMVLFALTTFAGFIVYVLLSVRYRKKLREKDEQLDRLKGDILMLKIKLASIAKQSTKKN